MSPAEQIERFIKAHPGEWREEPPENPDEMTFVLEVYPYRIKVEAYLSAVWGSLEHVDHHDTPNLDPCPVGASLLTQIAWQGADVLQAHGGSADTLPPWLADPVRRQLRTRAGELLTLAGSSPADVVSAAETVDEALCKRAPAEPTLSAVLATLMEIGMSCRWVRNPGDTGINPEREALQDARAALSCADDEMTREQYVDLCRDLRRVLGVT